MIENAILIKKGIMVNAYVRAKTQSKIVFAKNFMFGIPVHVSGSVINIVRLMNIRKIARA